MGDFYGWMLEQTQNPVTTLYEAQRAMWAEGVAPYYWAAFPLPENLTPAADLPQQER